MIIYVLTLFLNFSYAEIDVEEQIRMAEDPNYLDYVRERDREEAYERAVGYEYTKVREKEAAEEERARKDYVEWKRRQPIEDNSKEELDDMKMKAREEQEYLRLERIQAAQKHREEYLQIVAQQKILSMNRRPASSLPLSRTPRKARYFKTLPKPHKLKKVEMP